MWSTVHLDLALHKHTHRSISTSALLSDLCFVAQVHAQACRVRRFRLEPYSTFSFLQVCCLVLHRMPRWLSSQKMEVVRSLLVRATT
jgi:hypothetical protein